MFEPDTTWQCWKKCRHLAAVTSSIKCSGSASESQAAGSRRESPQGQACGKSQRKERRSDDSAESEPSVCVWVHTCTVS